MVASPPSPPTESRFPTIKPQPGATNQPKSELPPRAPSRPQPPTRPRPHSWKKALSTMRSAIVCAVTAQPGQGSDSCSGMNSNQSSSRRCSTLGGSAFGGALQRGSGVDCGRDVIRRGSPLPLLPPPAGTRRPAASPPRPGPQGCPDGFKIRPSEQAPLSPDAATAPSKRSSSSSSATTASPAVRLAGVLATSVSSRSFLFEGG